MTLNLEPFQMPEDLQKKADTISDERSMKMCEMIWKTKGAENFIIELEQYEGGIDSFWLRVQQAFSSDQPAQSLRLYQREFDATAFKEVRGVLTALSQTVKMIPLDINDRVMEILE